MAFTVSEQSPSSPSLEGIAFDANSTIAIGSIIISDLVGGTAQLRPGKINTTNTGNIEGISKTTIATAGTSIIVYTPIVQGQFVIADCTSNTAQNQLFKNHMLTNDTTLANSSTSENTSLGIFRALKLVGAAADKKLFGYLIKGDANV